MDCNSTKLVISTIYPGSIERIPSYIICDINYRLQSPFYNLQANLDISPWVAAKPPLLL